MFGQSSQNPTILEPWLAVTKLERLSTNSNVHGSERRIARLVCAAAVGTHYFQLTWVKMVRLTYFSNPELKGSAIGVRYKNKFRFSDKSRSAT